MGKSWEHFKEIQPQGYHNYLQLLLLDHQKKHHYQWIFFPYISERHPSVTFLEDTREGTLVISFVIVGSTSRIIVGKNVWRNFLKFGIDHQAWSYVSTKGYFWVLYTSFLQWRERSVHEQAS